MVIIYFKQKRLPYKDVTGGVNCSEGIGIAVVRFKDNGTIYPIAPVYVNPTAPRKTFSLSALKRFCGFTKVQETMLESCAFKDSNGETTTISCYHNNGLDFIEIDINKLKAEIKCEPTISQLTKVSRQSMSNLQKLQEAHIILTQSLKCQRKEYWKISR